MAISVSIVGAFLVLDMVAVELVPMVRLITCAGATLCRHECGGSSVRVLLRGVYCGGSTVRGLVWGRR